MSQLQKKFIAADAVDGSKIKLANNQALRARNAADSADIDLLKLDAANKLQMLVMPELPSDATGSQAVRFTQLQTYVADHLNGLKPKAAVRVGTVVAGTLASSFEAGDVVDTVTLVAGDRILIKNQAASEENGIYVVQASGAPVRASDFDSLSPIDEINGAYVAIQEGSQAGQLYVQQGAVSSVGVDPITFVFFNSTGTLTAGNGISIVGAQVSVSLDTDPGLEFNAAKLRAKVDAAGAISRGANGLAVKLEATDPSLQIASNELGVKLFSGGAIVKSASGVGVNLEASNPTLQVSSNELGVKLDAAGAIITGASGIKVQSGDGLEIATNTLKAKAADASISVAAGGISVAEDAAGAIVTGVSGIKVQIEASNPSLQISANELGLKMDAAGALAKGAGGVAVQVDNATVKIATNQLVAAKSEVVKITLGAGDITAQYVDLAAAAVAGTVSLEVVGAPAQELGVDYTVSETGGSGGVCRVSFAGDLATAGAAALVAGDKIIIRYTHL